MFRSLVVLVSILTAASPAFSSRLLVVSKGTKSLQSFDGKSYKPQFSVELPGDPHVVVVSPDRRHAYVGDYEGRDNTISIIDLKEGQRVGGIDVRPNYRPHDLAITRDGSTMYATCEASRSIAVIDLKAREVKSKIDILDSNIHMLALSPDERTLYATSTYSGKLWSANLAKGKTETAMFSGKGCEGIALARGGKEIWTVNRVIQTLSVIDAEKMQVLAEIPCVGNPMRAVPTPDGSTMLVSCGLSNDIALFDIARREEVQRVPVGNFPIDIAVTPDGKRFFVSNGRAADVSVVDAKALKVANSIPVGESPEGVVYVE